jgi:drug/metabolite transporter (DMT)-like permease
MENLKWIVALLAVSAIWGSTYAVTKDTLSFLDPFSHMAIRFSLAAILLAAYVFFTRKAISPDAAKAGCILGIVSFVGHSAQNFSLTYTSATNAAFIINLYVIITPFVSYILLRKLPSKRLIAAGFIAAIGMFFLTGATGKLNAGDLIAFIPAITFSVNYNLAGRFVQKHDSATLVLFQIAALAAASDIAMLLSGAAIGHLPLPTIVELLFLAVVATVIAFLVKMKAQKFVEPSMVALITSSEVIFASIFSIFLLNEALGGIQVFGCALIASGILLAQTAKKQ